MIYPRAGAYGGSITSIHMLQSNTDKDLSYSYNNDNLIVNNSH